jgi:hypothetical protein
MPVLIVVSNGCREVIFSRSHIFALTIQKQVLGLLTEGGNTMKIELLTSNNVEQQNLGCGPGDCSPVNNCNPDDDVTSEQQLMGCSPGDCSPVNDSLR